MIILKLIDKVLAKFTIFLIRIYQFTISPDKWLPSLWLKWKVCSHKPHCSNYSIKVLKRYWFISWIPKMTERIVACTPSKEKTYDPEYYKVVFFSWAPIWVSFLQELKNDKRFDLVWIVTMPDAPSGRWMEVRENIIKIEAKKIFNKISTKDEFFQTPSSLRLDSKKYGKEAQKFQQWLIDKDPDFLVVIAYWKIIPQYILDIPKIAPINVHGSLLPKYRGASPLQSVFLNNEKKTGITIMKMDANMDTGNMIDILKFDIDFDRNVKDLIDKILVKWPKFLNNTLRNFGKRQLWEVKQNENKATYCNKIEKEDWEINIEKDSLESIYNKYRAYYLWPKIYFFVWNNNKTKRVIIEHMKLDKKIFETEKKNKLFKGNELNKAILEIQIKPEWKKIMDRESFKRGYLK